jgi:hypothetical protein
VSHHDLAGSGLLTDLLVCLPLNVRHRTPRLIHKAQLADEALPAMIAERSDDSEPAALKAASWPNLRKPPRTKAWHFPHLSPHCRNVRARPATRYNEERGTTCPGNVLKATKLSRMSFIRGHGIRGSPEHRCRGFRASAGFLR